MEAHDQSWHAQHNAKHFPGTRQLCVKCDQPTERCEEDSIHLEDGTGPLCPPCYHASDEYAASSRIEYLEERLAKKDWQKHPELDRGMPYLSLSKEEMYAHMESIKPFIQERSEKIRQNRIDLTKPWKTYGGHKVEHLKFAREETVIRGTIVLREKPRKTIMCLWDVDGVAQINIIRHEIHQWDLVL